MNARTIFTAVILLAMISGLLTTKSAQAGDHEVGVFLGTGKYFGDLEKNYLDDIFLDEVGADPEIVFDEYEPAFGLLYRYYFNPRFNLKGGVNFGYISGDDANYFEDGGARQLSFRSHILEGSLQLEWNILPFVPRSDSYRFAPYVFGGISVFNFDPQAEGPDGDMHSLQPLGTEGQLIDGDDRYSLTQISIPFGVGFKYNLSNYWNIGLEVGGRKTFTDYLDDVSGEYAAPDALRSAANDAGEDGDLAAILGNPAGHTEGASRGNDETEDWYFFSGITISYTIRSFECNGDW